jgi:hypothetical protein
LQLSNGRAKKIKYSIKIFEGQYKLTNGRYSWGDEDAYSHVLSTFPQNVGGLWVREKSQNILKRAVYEVVSNNTLDTLPLAKPLNNSPYL